MDDQTRENISKIVRRGMAETIAATIDAAQLAIDARIAKTHWAGDVKLLRLVSADLDKLRVQSPHDTPES